MKSGTGKGAPDREHGYWEPPTAALGRIEGKIQDIEDAGEPAPTEPQTRRQRLVGTLLVRRRMVAAGCCAVAILVAALVLGSPGSKSGASGKSASSSDAAVAGALQSQAPGSSSPGAYQTQVYFPDHTFADSGDSESDDSGSDDTPAPVVAKGWPVSIDGGIAEDDLVDGPSIGPDGTVYLPGVQAIDSTGHARADWLKLPDGGDATPVVFAADGTIYAAFTPNSDSNSNTVAPTQLFAYDKNGKVRAGWPIDVGTDADFQAGPSNSIYVFSTVGSKTKATVFSPAAKTLASWVIGSSEIGECGVEVTPNGSVYYAYSGTGGNSCSILVFSSSGTVLSSSPVRAWDGLDMAADGSVYAYGRDAEPYNTNIVARTRIALIGTDGQAAPGWPVNIEGAASEPAIGADGTVYVAQLGSGTTPSRILAYDKNGAAKAGWPVDLPAGYAPFSSSIGDPPNAVTIAGNGTVYVAATNSSWMGSILAYDPTGQAVPGWPYTLPQPFVGFGSGNIAWNPGLLYTSAVDGGRLYVGLDGEVVALSADGKVVPGWPYVFPDSASGDTSWDSWALAPDGGILVVTEVDGQDSATDRDTTTAVAVDLTPDGKARH